MSIRFKAYSNENLANSAQAYKNSRSPTQMRIFLNLSMYKVPPHHWWIKHKLYIGNLT